MFYSAEQAMIKAQKIIEDDKDNDIIFVIAPKGVGKTGVLQSIYGSLSFNDKVIVSDGRSINSSSSRLKKCFAEGIIEYIRRNNSIHTRKQLCHHLESQMCVKRTISTIYRRKVRTDEIASYLCELSISRLKEIYYDIAGDFPLIILSNSITLLDEEIRYLNEIGEDQLGMYGARVTFVIGIRTSSQNLSAVDRIIRDENTGIWVMPLLPAINGPADSNNPKKLAPISMPGKPTTRFSLQEHLSGSNVYIETLEIVNWLISSHWPPYLLSILANQETPLIEYDDIQEVTRIVFHQRNQSYNNKVLLPDNGKLIWVDVLSYYLLLQKDIHKAISETQRFFLGILKEIVNTDGKIRLCKSSNSTFLRFLGRASVKKPNILAEGLSKYYSDFAKLVRLVAFKNPLNNQFFPDILDAVDVLGRVDIQYSSNNLKSLIIVYKDTQICYVLDIGLLSVLTFIRETPREDYPSDCFGTIRSYIQFCLEEAYRWNDITLLDEIIQVFAEAKRRGGLEKHLKLQDISADEDKKGLYECLLQLLTKYHLEVEDIKMPATYTPSKMLLVVATPLELEVLINKLNAVGEVKKTVSSISYFAATIGKTQTYVVKSQMGQGGPGGAILTIEEAIRVLNPDFVIMGGIAWGGNKEKQCIGDLLISSQVWDYDIERKNPDGTTTYRGSISPASPYLVQMFEVVCATISSYRTRIGLIASGSDLYDNKNLVDELKAVHSELIGGDMESAGMASVCTRKKVDWIMAKGICDWGYDKNDHKDEYQELAANNSMDAIVSLLLQFSPQ